MLMFMIHLIFYVLLWLMLLIVSYTVHKLHVFVRTFCLGLCNRYGERRNLNVWNVEKAIYKSSGCACFVGDQNRTRSDSNCSRLIKQVIIILARYYLKTYKRTVKF